jgi:hypothetical protein
VVQRKGTASLRMTETENYSFNEATSQQTQKGTASAGQAVPGYTSLMQQHRYREIPLAFRTPASSAAANVHGDGGRGLPDHFLESVECRTLTCCDNCRQGTGFACNVLGKGDLGAIKEVMVVIVDSLN